MEGLASILPLLIIVVLFYVLLLRPARAQQQRVRRVQAALAPGAHVVTSAGLHATVAEVRDDGSVVLTAEPAGTQLVFDRQAVVRVVEPAPTVEGSEGGATAAPLADDVAGPTPYAGETRDVRDDDGPAAPRP